MGLEVRGLAKTYGQVTVMADVDFDVADGEIHALLGANGAGKSTLIKCVSGAVQPDRGEIVVGGRVVRSHTPRSAKHAGVAVIYQDFSVAASLTVAENVFLGQERRRGPFVRRREQRAETRRLLTQLGATLDPDATMDVVGGADLQIVEIVKALVARPKVLVLDEPTAALTDDEARALADTCRRLRDLGLAIVYVTHRLSEVFDLADRVTVMRGGRVVLSRRVADTDRAELVDTIAGRRVQDDRAVSVAARDAQPALELRAVTSAGVGPVDLAAYGGEVLGIYGLLGSGRTELLETIVGAQRMVSGTMVVDGRARRFRRPADAAAARIALVPSDRLRKGVFLTLPGRDNVLLPSYRAVAGALTRRPRRETARFTRVAERLKLHPMRGDIPGRGYSGGNQQKLVVGRWLATDCHVFLLDEPTQGVDVGARRELYDALRDLATAGHAVVLTSSEPDELRQVADRVVVLARGRVVAEVPGAEVSERTLLELSHANDEPAAPHGAVEV